MNTEKIPFEKTGFFSSLFLDYIQQKESLKAFYQLPPEKENFRKQIDLKNFPTKRREVLVQVLQEQYEGVEISESVAKNIQSLGEKNTFTITTGHQLNIFTGPLYFIYKIVTVINACRELSAMYPEYNFVPVYWMGSEDHDFEEISWFVLNGKKYQWETNQKGAVGRMKPDGLEKILDNMPGHHPIFEKAYRSGKNVSEAARIYVNELFKEYGLVVVEADHQDLKREFLPVIRQDIFDGVSMQQVSNTTQKLEELGYTQQVYPRDINFFYVKEGLRERIEREGEIYRVIDSNISFTPEEIEEEMNNYPERFSPNVILRPLYQETILPNLAYVGGPSEVTYWLQLGGVFKQFATPLPVLMPRNFALVIPSHIKRKWNQTSFSIEDLFRSTDDLLREFTKSNSTFDLELETERATVAQTLHTIRDQAHAIDPTLGPHVEAQIKKWEKTMHTFSKKMLRAEKRKMSDRTQQVEAVKEFLFPGNGLQERRDNFLNFYMENPNFINDLSEVFDPFDFRFHMLMDE